MDAANWHDVLSFEESCSSVLPRRPRVLPTSALRPRLHPGEENLAQRRSPGQSGAGGVSRQIRLRHGS